MLGELDASIDTMLAEVQDGVNQELERQYGQLGHALRDLFYELLNFPLERPWRESLAIFAEHWTDRGLKLTPRTLNAIGRLIAEELEGAEEAPAADDMDMVLAEAPDLRPQTVGTDAIFYMPPATSPAEAQDRKLRMAARVFAARAQERLQLTEDEQTHLEFFTLENLRRHERGWPLLPPPEYYFVKERAYQERIARQPAIRGLTRQEAARSEKAAQYARYCELSPREREKLDRDALAEARSEYEAEYGWFAAFLNPAFDGTGTFNDAIMTAGGFTGMPGLRGGQRLGPLASPGRRSRRGSSPKTAKASTPRGQGRSGRKPAFPRPAAKQRVTIRKGRRTPHPSHLRAAESEEQAARFIHTLPYEVVLFWGQKIGAHGADVVSYNLKTRTVTLWDVKWRGTPVRIRRSKTFRRDQDPLRNALRQAVKAVRASRLSGEHKGAAFKSIDRELFKTRTLGAGHAKNSAIGVDP